MVAMEVEPHPSFDLPSVSFIAAEANLLILAPELTAALRIELDGYY